ncbi:hypothetical protein B0H16DRAFT_1567947 [Mycena metata]|uniref:VWFA domain-containing protein n=1 Tax=Mycena metata TaxID=1033252 RepID=A0AAD7IC83_9AGAR|nr:hypothetical protein B0H16DRAFT_1567947 [Mycena metata]
MSEKNPEPLPRGGSTPDTQNERSDNTTAATKFPFVENPDDAGSVASSDEFFSTAGEQASAHTERPSVSLDAEFSADPMDVDPPAPVSTDLMYSVNGMFRALELCTEHGSGGLVNKIIIAQESLQAFINELSPGAYSSLTKVDFKRLDELLIKPAGLYGSKSEIVAFLSAHGAVDELTAHALCLSKDNTVGPSLRSGLYLLRSYATEPGEEQIFVIYWPEDTTWDDNAISSISRNRETFMRYLTKICDQVTCLISKEHAGSIVWNNESEDAATNEDNNKPSRLYKFKVAKTNEQEETVQHRPGFQIQTPLAAKAQTQDEAHIDPADLEPRLICGETKQGLLTTVYAPAGFKTELLHQEVFTSVHLRDLLKGGVEFGPDLSDEAIEALSSPALGVESKYPKALENWKERGALRRRQYNESLKKQQMDLESRVVGDTEQKRSVFRQALIDGVTKQFPSIEQSLTPNISNEERSNLRDQFSALVKDYHLITTELEAILEGPKFATIEPEVKFKHLKETLLYIKVFFDTRRDLSGSQRDAIIIEHLNKQGYAPSLPDTKHAKDSNFIVAALSYASALTSSIPYLGSRKKKDDEKTITAETRRVVASTSDAQFLADLPELVVEEPVLSGIASDTLAMAVNHFQRLLDKSSNILVGKAVQIQQDVLKTRLKRDVKNAFARRRHESLQLLRVEMEQGTPSAPVLITALDPPSQKSSYRVKGYARSSSAASLDCQIHLLSLTTDDRAMVQTESNHVVTPHLMLDRATFSLKINQRIVHTQLIESEDLLLIVEDSQCRWFVYLEKLHHLYDLRPRKTIHRAKVGENPIFVYDESTRMLLICSTSEPALHLFAFDETCTSLQGAGSLPLGAGYYPEGAAITHACFVSGGQEILLIDNGNMARIYSLLPRQFRPATLTLPQRPISAYSSPDGACLLLSYQGEAGLFFRAYHWNTFGSPGSQGIELGTLQVPCSSLCLTSLVSRRNVHLVGIDDGVCASVAFEITKKTTDFMFTETADKNLPKTRHNNTITHNTLIDCHSDVWARFPVVAAVQRQTIISSKNRLPRSFTFSTYSDYNKFAPHFDDLILTFEQQTRKPTGNELKRINISSLNIDGVIALLSSNTRWAVSEFRAGEWLVDLLCLIPIQIAVTQENRFIPLKDGKVSDDLERRLLGAEVGQIVDSLSLGWYESVFQSYMVSKPVKVVSSMGEQSVGKSFSLNHLVDTSFAGSAMRTTEGVWMVVTPTEKTLIVALDFEGVHSIERSAQEDTLLVLFNTAISNLVLFRNNFAMSRSITGLFQSFQSSSNVLDPAANPQLFRSTLVIIIKDVVDSDEREIVREFSTKFHKIVEDEQDANFISRLHDGQLDIIPWPVINSKQFYALFPTLTKTLDQQEVTHPTAGEFLYTLKTLMAKLKANDWAALSETLAAHRAQKLCDHLDTVLEFGFYEADPVIEPLKNFDTDLPIDRPDTPTRFLLSKSEATHQDRQNILALFQKSWDQFEVRNRIPEVEWTDGLSKFLLDRAELRIEYVFRWIQSNLARFQSNHPNGVKSNHANLELLRREFEAGAVDLRLNVEICRMQCASCNLLCILGRRHATDTPHNCQTSHRCPHPCEYEHDEFEECGYPAGHSDKHICVVGVHLCGEACMLEDKNGCMKKCTKVAKHPDEEHTCAARVHSCGEPCSLQHLKLSGNKGAYSCPQTCTIPSHEDHVLHLCSTPSCPISCELCSRLCSNTVHLHGLDPDARHLCEQAHDCKASCQARGICQIDTTPQAIETRFIGRHENYAYTKVSPVSKHLLCAIKIPPGEREHRGRHIHSEDPDPFHFCETQCLNCGYFCTLPIGHPQQEHETSHGSMSKTSWNIDGLDDTILEVKGRKFASQDSGAPMMCNLFCQDMGRHVHIDYCRATEDVLCGGAEVEHIRPNQITGKPKDWLSHSLFWKRSGFKDPYSRDDQANFAKCEYMCPGPEHATNPPVPSYCTLPVLHAPATGQLYVLPTDPNAQAYISSDGHSYACKNPAEMRPAYHVIFVIDKSSSMRSRDLLPLANRPETHLISRQNNNRLGAVFSALHAFWVSRSAAMNPDLNRTVPGARRDAYSVIFFDAATRTCMENDSTSTPEQLLHSVLRYSASGSTNFGAALVSAEGVMRQHWSDARAPVVIFLSDGECNSAEATIEHLSRTALELGHPLSFQSVLFGGNRGRASLSRMAEVALDVQNAAPNNAAQHSAPSSFCEAFTEVRLAETFLGFAESLRKPRGSLLR